MEAINIKTKTDIVNLLPPNPVTCEVGVAGGRFSLDILKGWNPSLHYAVDNWATIENERGDGNFHQLWHNMNYHTMLWNLKDYMHKVKIIKGISWDMAVNVPDETIDFIYLDANHSLEAVKKDLEAWYPKLKVGGIMAGHDYLNPDYGVEQSARAFCHKIGTDIYTIPEQHSWDANFIFRKPKRKD